MAKVISGMAMSLDGCIQDRDGSVGALYPDLAALRDSQPLQESIRNTGAVVVGWNAFAMAEDPDSYAGNYEYQVPIFVLTRHAPEKHPKDSGTLTFTFVTDGIESAIRQAMQAAGAKDVTVMGAPVRSGSASRRVSPMSCTSTSCRCSWAVACACLRRTAVSRSAWRGSQFWTFPEAGRICASGS